MATTTNYSWTTPDNTDLVKDGAAAIRTLGSSADTTVKNLNPGTTAGDIDYYTSGTAKARIAIGTAGQVLTVNAGATAPEWGSVSGGWTLITSGTLSSTTTTVSSISGAYTDLKIIFIGATSSSAGEDLYIFYNNNSGVYNPGIIFTTGTDIFGAVNSAVTDNMIANNVDTTGTNNAVQIVMQDYARGNGWKRAEMTGWNARNTGNYHWFWYQQRVGIFAGINRFDVTATAGNLSGSYFVYGL